MKRRDFMKKTGAGSLLAGTMVATPAIAAAGPTGPTLSAPWGADAHLSRGVIGGQVNQDQLLGPACPTNPWQESG